MVFAASEVASSSDQPLLLLEVDSVFLDHGFQVLVNSIFDSLNLVQYSNGHISVKKFKHFLKNISAI